MYILHSKMCIEQRMARGVTTNKGMEWTPATLTPVTISMYTMHVSNYVRDTVQIHGSILS